MKVAVLMGSASDKAKMAPAYGDAGPARGRGRRGGHVGPPHARGGGRFCRPGPGNGLRGHNLRRRDGRPPGRGGGGPDHPARDRRASVRARLWPAWTPCTPPSRCRGGSRSPPWPSTGPPTPPCWRPRSWPCTTRPWPNAWLRTGPASPSADPCASGLGQQALSSGRRPGPGRPASPVALASAAHHVRASVPQ